MQTLRVISTAAVVAGVMGIPGTVLAQVPASPTAPKTIGSTVRAQMVPSLIVMNARGPRSRVSS